MEVKVESKPEVTIVEPKDIYLEPGELGAILELIVKDKDGKVQDYRKLKSKSFVQQFMQLLHAQFAEIGSSIASTYQIRDTSNALKNARAYSGNFRADAGAGVVTHGIRVGTGGGGPTVADYALQTPIAHGVAAGNLQYSAMTFGAPAWDATTSQFTLTRVLANGSGGAITVNEIGLYVSGFDGGIRYFMTIRDVIAGGIAVANGASLTVNYRIQGVV